MGGGLRQGSPVGGRERALAVQTMGVDPQQMELYIEVWQRVEPMAQAGRPMAEIEAEITGSGLEPEHQRRMKTQVARLHGAGG